MRQTLVFSVAVSSALVALAVLARSLAIAPRASGPALLVLGAIAGGATGLLPAAVRSATSPQRSWLLAAGATACAALILLVARLSVGAESLAAIVLAWLTVIASGVAAVALWRRGSSVTPRAVAAPQRVAKIDAEEDDSIVERIERRRVADGAIHLTGTLRTPLEAGQRIVQLHLAFCPPLDAAPTIEIEQIAGPEAQWRVAAAWPHAARLEGKLAARAAAGETIGVEFFATTGGADTTPTA